MKENIPQAESQEPAKDFTSIEPWKILRIGFMGRDSMGEILPAGTLEKDRGPLRIGYLSGAASDDNRGKPMV